MSVESIHSSISQYEKELVAISKKISDETKKEMNARKRIQQIEKSINKNTSASLVKSKMSEINRKNSEIIRCQEKLSKFKKDESDKRAKIQELNRMLYAEQKKEREQYQDLEKRFDLLQQNVDNYLKSEYRSQNSEEQKEYDIFISHATDDKDSLVRPLALKLEELGLMVWYDEFALKLGDSLREKIDYGLSHSRYGAVILSNDFFNKKWPQYELNGLVAREMNGHKVILPIWHRVTKDEVIQFSPTLADKLALNSVSYSISEMANEIKAVIVS